MKEEEGSKAEDSKADSKPAAAAAAVAAPSAAAIAAGKKLTTAESRGAGAVSWQTYAAYARAGEATVC